MRYTVVYEKGENNWSAFSPDVPGCIATGKDRQETEQNFKEALEFHLEGLLEDGDPIPEPVTEVGTVDVRLPQLAGA